LPRSSIAKITQDAAIMHAMILTHGGLFVHTLPEEEGSPHAHRRRTNQNAMDAATKYMLSFLRRAPVQHVHTHKVRAAFELQKALRRTMVANGQDDLYVAHPILVLRARARISSELLRFYISHRFSLLRRCSRVLQVSITISILP